MGMFDDATGEDNSSDEGFESIDLSDFGVAEETETSQESQPDNEVETPGEDYPPFWKPVFEQLPKEFHNLLTPELKKWDQNYTAGIQKARQDVEQKYASFKQFQDAGITPDSLMSAHKVAQRINNEPEKVLEELRNMLVQEGRITEARQVQAEIDELEDDDDDPTTAKMRELEAQQQQMLQAWQAQAEQQQAVEIEQRNQQIAAEATQTVQQEMADLESKYGPMSDFAKKSIADNTSLLQDRLGRVVPLEEGYKQFIQTVKYARGAAPGARAPRLMPNGGGNPAPKPVDLSNEEARIAAIERIAREAQENR